MTSIVSNVDTNKNNNEINNPILNTHIQEIKKYNGLDRVNEVIVCRKDTIQSKFSNGPYRRLNLNVYIRGETYPSSGIVVELSSFTVAAGVVKKIQIQCEKKIVNNDNNNNILLEILLFIQTIVQENKLLCCVHEIRKAKKMLGKHCTDLIMNESTGAVRMNIQFEKYSAILHLSVPDNYPIEPPDIKLTKATFPKKVARIYTMQAKEILRKCSLGYTAEMAMMASRPEKVPPKSKKEKEIVITNDLTNQLKNDIKFLKKVSDLKNVNNDKGKRNQFFEHDKNTRKAARRELRKLKKSEVQKELNWQEEATLRQEKEDAALVSKAARGEGATHSIGPLIDFISNHFILRLPVEKCQGCEKPLLPADPTKSAAVFDKDNKKRARRVWCSHWWHHNCLNKVLTKPPFGLQGCPACGLRVWHHEWERDIKRLERRWAAKQARDRELNEVADSFGGLGEEFMVKRKKKKNSDDEDESSEDDSDDVDAKASAMLFEKW